MVHDGANGHVHGVARVLATTHASGEGGARSVGVCRGWRTGAFSARSQRGLACSGSVVQGLAVLEAWTGGGDGRWLVLQTCLLGLVLLLACCRHVGGKLGSAWSPLMAMPSSRWS